MRFGRWTVLVYGKKCLCRCDCGTERQVLRHNLDSGGSRSCGCLHRENLIARNTTHGLSRAEEYSIWKDMIRRCHRARGSDKRDYADRGITVCDRWRSSFETFYADMGSRPSTKHSIERKNNDGNYERRNCIWATDEEQRRNRSDNHWLEAYGLRMVLADWARMTHMSTATIWSRLKAGVSPDEAVRTGHRRPGPKPDPSKPRSRHRAMGEAQEENPK